VFAFGGIANIRYAIALHASRTTLHDATAALLATRDR